MSGGWVWGAIGFGGASGDIMHFDGRGLGALAFVGGGTVGRLRGLVGG